MALQNGQSRSVRGWRLLRPLQLEMSWAKRPPVVRVTIDSDSVDDDKILIIQLKIQSPCRKATAIS